MTQPSQSSVGKLLALALAIVGLATQLLPILQVTSWVGIFFLLVALSLAGLVLRAQKLADDAETSIFGWRQYIGLAWRDRQTQISVTLALAFAGLLCWSSVSGTLSGQGLEPAGICIPVGNDQPEYREAFLAAYNRYHKADGIDCGTNAATVFGNGVVQNFKGSEGLGAITATTTSTAYVINPRVLTCVNHAVRGSESFPAAGYPAAEPSPLKRGLQILLGATLDDSKQPQAVIMTHSNGCFWVTSDFWHAYNDLLGGPDGRLGYPTGPESTTGTGYQQEFEHGSLILEDNQVVLRTPGAADRVVGINAQINPGYYLIGADGGVFAYGETFFNSLGANPPQVKIVGGAVNAAADGYWLVDASGHVYALGQAPSVEVPTISSSERIAAIASSPQGGYWLVTSLGHVISAGGTRNYGSVQAAGTQVSIAGIAATPDGLGYWLVSTEGRIYNFGDARPYSIDVPAETTASGVEASPRGGIWIVCSDGTVVAQGTPYYGSAKLGKTELPASGIATTPDGLGYWIADSAGNTYAFGDAPSYRSVTPHLNAPIVGVVVPPHP